MGSLLWNRFVQHTYVHIHAETNVSLNSLWNSYLHYSYRLYLINSFRKALVILLWLYYTASSIALYYTLYINKLLKSLIVHETEFHNYYHFLLKSFQNLFCSEIQDLIQLCFRFSTLTHCSRQCRINRSQEADHLFALTNVLCWKQLTWLPKDFISTTFYFFRRTLFTYDNT